MLAYILNNPCTKCGGDIVVTKASDGVVSGGSCMNCLCNVVLPQEHFSDFVNAFCYKKSI